MSQVVSIFASMFQLLDKGVGRRTKCLEVLTQVDSVLFKGHCEYWATTSTPIIRNFRIFHLGTQVL